ncbi:MAG: GNAT family N-acetyltransferase, partial [Bacteroidota bacterium]
MLFHHLETSRLRLRPLAPDDKTPLLEFFTDPVATQFLFNELPPEAYADAWLAKQLRRYETGSGGLLAVERLDTGEFVGQCGLLRQFVEGIPKWEVGYHFIRRFWGNGFATEAAAACRDFAFEND